ncbi:hypothetical protein EYZ11_011472 [Aspergillus tanneri]|uniref:Uncharacterized protein n=1 Tax=Aspergillus tanneri TaxID=1220188 RepID=A0A4S3J2P6_9EURO|nr:hypothetical protein EYZ11_011472 [Aspergillus tanneri]
MRPGTPGSRNHRHTSYAHCGKIVQVGLYTESEHQ